MDPLTEARAKAKEIAAELYDILTRPIREGDRGLQEEWASVLEGALLLAFPVPTPSADARAKLEQALDHWASARDRMYVAKDAMDEVFRAGQFPQSRKHERLKRNYNDAVMGEANAAIEVLRLHRLSALPPHEGETPQPAAE